MSKILINKIREVKTPDRGTSQAAGLDFYMPKIDDSFIKAFLAKNPTCSLDRNFNEEKTALLIPPHTRVLIPSGIRTYMNRGTALIAENKSGLSTKKGLLVTATTVDSDYTGEIHLGLYNSDKFETAEFVENDKVLQFIHHEVFLSEVTEVDNLDFDIAHWETERGDKGFGSTSKKN